jgi:hypothetical protein
MVSVEKEKRVYSKTELYVGNLAIIMWILLGAASCWLLHPLAALAFTALSGFLVYYELGKKGCLSCYYCKTCSIGMGKLPDLFFTKKGTENLNRKAIKLFPYVYVLLAAVPIALVLFSAIQEFSVLKLALLAALLVYSFVTGFVRRRTIFMGKP